LIATMNMMGLNDNVFFSTQSLEFNQMNVLHNISDFCINIALNEGFGLATLEAMQAGKPIIATKTGGLTRQVVDHRDGSENGIALEPDVRSMVGSQMVPYIYEDYVQNEKAAEAIYQMYKMGPEKRKNLGQKARDYTLSEFNIYNTIDKWHESLWELTEKWKKDKSSVYKSWELMEF